MEPNPARVVQDTLETMIANTAKPAPLNESDIMLLHFWLSHAIAEHNQRYQKVEEMIGLTTAEWAKDRKERLGKWQIAKDNNLFCAQLDPNGRLTAKQEEAVNNFLLHSKVVLGNLDFKDNNNMVMNRLALHRILNKHSEYLKDIPTGECADLTGACIGTLLDKVEVNLEGATMVGCKLRGAELTRANFRDANLSGADLSGACLIGADLRGANLSGANLSGVDGGVVKLEGANLAGANLSYIKLYNADLSNVDLSKALNAPVL